LLADGHQIEVNTREMGKEDFERWSKFLTPTFPVVFRFEGSERLLFRDKNTGRKFALFVFKTPTAFRRSVVSFEQLRICGMLRSQVLNIYSVVADADVFAILLSEDQGIDPDPSCDSALSKTLIELREVKQKLRLQNRGRQ
jgi:hypothetical protein